MTNQDDTRTYPYALGFTLSKCQAAAQLLADSFSSEDAVRIEKIKLAIDILENVKHEAETIVGYLSSENEGEL